MPVPSASALRAATALAGTETHWTDGYRRPGSEADDPDEDAGPPDHNR
ncbi:hypothetical protein [Plantactinospora sp. KBS50]|nr:hypothetical protein [Plantactinospora sp. KBS50]